jgi:ABC-type antimicrobial peptide transport system permease subunit
VPLTQPDPGVLRKAQRGDERAFTLIVRAYETPVYNYVVRLIGGIGLMGLVLTMVGLYGLVAYAVNRRTREIGIRIAIGATYRRIVQMVLRQGLTPVWYGVLAGLVLSTVTARTLLTLVPIHYRLDGRTYLFVVPMVVIVTIAAAFIPARRAARVDPTTALRCD